MMRPVRTVLITGGSGFIGRNLADALAERYEVLAPRHAELELTDDEAVRLYLRETRPDVVVHAAVRPAHRNAKDPTRVVEDSVRMFFNLVRDPDLCPRMVTLSSGAVYGSQHYVPRMTEDYFDTWVPDDELGLSKYVMAKYAEHVPEQVTELRLFGVFGPYEDYAIRFISNAACKALLGMPVTLRQDRLFDYLWVKDLPAIVEHYMRLTRPAPATNVTSGQPVSLLDLAHLVVEVARADVPVVVAEEGRGVEYTGDNARLRAEMPDLRLTPIRDAVEELVAWYRGRLSTLDVESLRVDR